jgi:hypothetical protein
MIQDNKSKIYKTLLIVGFLSIMIDFAIEAGPLKGFGLLLLGVTFLFFNKEIGTDRYVIDKQTKSDLLKNTLFKSESISLNRVVVIIVGGGFLIGGIAVLSMV